MVEIRNAGERRYDPVTDGRLMRAKEVAGLYGYHTDTLRKWREKWRREPNGPLWVTLGSARNAQVRYPERWVLDWINEQDGSAA